ncbi:MAG: class I SAM-dependent methyltransferase [Pontiellaceae bacterium]|nr:class I SAM-dependent methyltransferase [Pontiellaceae bacterium]
MTWLQSMAGRLADSVFFRRGRILWDQNRIDAQMPLSKKDKILTGLYLICSDYAAGKFPPGAGTRDEVYAQELNFGADLPGMDSAGVERMEMSKPFWAGGAARFLRDSAVLFDALRRTGIKPPMKILEIGCGSGWLSEFMARTGFRVTATSLHPRSIRQVKQRAAFLSGLLPGGSLQGMEVPMEALSEKLASETPFDGVVVYEALHHAYDWQLTIAEAGAVLRPGGWFFILSEPNRVHTLTSYRMSILTGTPERGFQPAELRRTLAKNGFNEIIILKNRWHFGIRHIWYAAQKAGKT